MVGHYDSLHAREVIQFDHVTLTPVQAASAWRPIRLRSLSRPKARFARRLFKQLSYKCPAETILRLRRGSEVLIKMPADGLANVRE